MPVSRTAQPCASRHTAEILVKPLWLRLYRGASERYNNASSPGFHMRTLAFLAAVILGAGSAVASPIVMDDNTTLQRLAADEFMSAWSDAAWAEPELVLPHSLLAAELWQSHAARGVEPGLADTTLGVGLVVFRSPVTSDMLRVQCDDFDVLPQSLGTTDGTADLLAAQLDPSRLLASEIAARDEPAGVAAASVPPAPETAPARPRDIAKAALSRVQPATLTVSGVCLVLALGAWREWRRRHGHVRHSHRRYSLHRH